MRRRPITRVHLVTSASVVDATSLKTEFPTVRIEAVHAARVDDVVIDSATWLTTTTFDALDDAVTASSASGIIVRGDAHVLRVAYEALTRYQRFIERCNSFSEGVGFARLLRAHRALEDEGDRHLRAEVEHAVDAWQWTIRLRSTASLTIQLAALLHRVDPVVASRVLDIVALERRGLDGDEIALLHDANALSFLSLSSAAYLDHFGPTQTRRMIAATMRRLGDGARAKLAFVRLRPDVRALFCLEPGSGAELSPASTGAR